MLDRLDDDSGYRVLGGTFVPYEDLDAEAYGQYEKLFEKPNEAKEAVE